MSDDSERIEVLGFHKEVPNGVMACRLEVFDDGSVCAIGDDILAWFEFDDDCKGAAIQYLTNRGYVFSRRGSQGT